MHNGFWKIPVWTGLNPGTLGLRDPLQFFPIVWRPTTLHRSRILIGGQIKKFIYMHDVFWQIPVRIGLNPGTLGLRDPIHFLHIFWCPTTLHRSRILIGAKIKNSVKKGLTPGPDRVNWLMARAQLEITLIPTVLNFWESAGKQRSYGLDKQIDKQRELMQICPPPQGLKTTSSGIQAENCRHPRIRVRICTSNARCTRMVSKAKPSVSYRCFTK